MIHWFLRRSNPNYYFFDNTDKDIICFAMNIGYFTSKQWLDSYNGDGRSPHYAISVPRSCVQKVLKIDINKINNYRWPLPWPAIGE